MIRLQKLKELDEKQTKWADYLNNVKQLRITGEKQILHLMLKVENGLAVQV